MLKIGLTGGIGCGKSTVAKYFAKLGIMVIDSDAIVHELMAHGTSTFEKIVKHFGIQILLDSGGINRRQLREIIFANVAEREWLEKLIHPQVFKELKIRAEQVQSPYCILVIPLLLETNAQKEVDKILVVECSQERRIKRVIERDKVSVAAVKAIMKTQVDRKTRLQNADDIIYNDGSLINLRSQVKRLHQKYLTIKS